MMFKDRLIEVLKDMRMKEVDISCNPGEYEIRKDRIIGVIDDASFTIVFDANGEFLTHFAQGL